jgi:7,8-dihydro-6-hydroxymethylpterin dimethyltransferase
VSETGYLGTTTSTCGECGRLLPARIHLQQDGAWFHKHCPEHGPQRVRFYGDAEQYLRLSRFHRAGSKPLAFATKADKGCPDSCGLCPEHEQHVCMPIIEITDHCDLACPICLVRNRSSFHLTRQQVARILDALIAGEGQLDIVNLSGGEPTLNPDFREIVEECVSRAQVLRVSVSTNGLRLAAEPDLLRFLADRNVVVSLQFDGFEDGVYERLRGRPLLSQKLRLIDAASALDAPMSLTATAAAGVNEAHINDLPRLLFERRNILSLMFQPAAYVGMGSALCQPENRTTIPDVTRQLDGACNGLVSAGDFSPLPCSHPACFSLAFYLRVGDGEFVPFKRLVPIDRYMDVLQNRAIFGTDAESFEGIREAVYELWSGPAGQSPDSERALRAVKTMLAAINRTGYQPARAIAVAERSIKSIFIHQFMDLHTFDLARARKCCNVYPLADGRMMPACVYNCLRR